MLRVSRFLGPIFQYVNKFSFDRIMKSYFVTESLFLFLLTMWDAACLSRFSGPIFQYVENKFVCPFWIKETPFLVNDEITQTFIWFRKKRDEETKRDNPRKEGNRKVNNSIWNFSTKYRDDMIHPFNTSFIFFLFFPRMESNGWRLASRQLVRCFVSRRMNNLCSPTVRGCRKC